MTIRSLSAAVVSIAVVTNTPVMTFALERNWMGRRHAPKGTGHLCFENYLEQISFNTFHSLEIVKKNAGGKDNHKGDFIIKDDNIEILIENECYVNDVPKRE